MSDFAPYIEAQRRRVAENERRTRQRSERARAAAMRVAAHLGEAFGVHRVVLVGSLARGDFRTDSDIDLVVEGMPTDALFRAGAEAEDLAGEFLVDLVPWESANERMREVVAAEGVVLFARA